MKNRISKDVVVELITYAEMSALRMNAISVIENWREFKRASDGVLDELERSVFEFFEPLKKKRNEILEKLNESEE